MDPSDWYREKAMPEDPKEFIEALGERKTQTAEIIQSIVYGENLAKETIQCEILTNQLAMLRAAQVLTAMVSKIERRLDALEEWNQGHLKPDPGKSDSGIRGDPDPEETG